MLSPEATMMVSRCGGLCRDTTLDDGLLSLYQVGLMFRERAYVDGTYKFGGLAAPHRYLILTARAICLEAYGPHPEWGLCVCKCDSIFKVLATTRRDGRSQVTLLQIPEEMREEFGTAELSPIEQEYAEEATRHFEEALQLEPRPEHTTEEWLKRLRFPLGFLEDGVWFECWPPTH